MPLESARERESGIRGSLEKLLYRLGIAVTRLADVAREGPDSYARREARSLLAHDYENTGLDMLIYLYENRIGEGIYESVLLDRAGNLGECDDMDCQNARHRQDMHVLERLWELIITQRPAHQAWLETGERLHPGGQTPASGEHA